MVITKDNVEKMKYTLAVLMETLRRYTPVPVVARRLDKPDVINGYKVPAGVGVIVHLQVRVGVARKCARAMVHLNL